MRHGRVSLVVLSLALVSLAEDVVQNSTDLQPECQHILGIDRNEYMCSGLNVNTYINVKKASINCKGGQLDCSKLPRLPYGSGQVLQGLSVENCGVESLTCALSSLNARGANMLSFRAVNTPLTADAVEGMERIATLYIYGPPRIQKTIPVEALKLLPNLKMFRLSDEGVTAIPPNTFNGTSPELEFLEVSLNNIKVLQDDAFNGLGKLKTLSLFTNKIEEIQPNTFRGLASLENLYLNDNNMSVVPARMLASTPRLRTLTMSGNKRALRLDATALPGLQHLEEIVIQSHGELTLEPAALSNLLALTDVMLRDSGVTSLPADLFLNSSAVVNLTLSWNKLSSLPSSVFASLARLRLLDLSHNELERVDQNMFQPLQRVREIRLQHNRIQVLNEQLFNTLLHLKTVDLSHNMIVTVHPQAFQNEAIINLDLSHNQLTWRCRSEDSLIADGSYIIFEFHSPLATLKNMDRLDLSHNNIGDICSDWLYVMTYLSQLDLSYNNLTQLTAGDINFASKYIKVNLKNNHITTMEPPSDNNNTQSLYLGGNPFHCDCHLFPLLRSLKRLPYDSTQAVCDLPRALRGCGLDSIAAASQCRFRSVSVANLTCPIQYEVPPGCACLVRPAENRTECDCDDLTNKTLPDPTLNGGEIDRMLLRLRSVAQLGELEGFVNRLDLSGLGLETVPQIPVNVTYVDLSRNKLSRVPAELLTRNLTLVLERNPLECDCPYAEDVANLQTYQLKIRDYSTLLCKDNVTIQQVDASRLCNVQHAVRIGVPLAVIIIILAVTIPLIYRYSLEIRLWLIKIGCTWLWPDLAHLQDKDKKYDIFLSFVHQDEEFVTKKLLPELEKTYKVCIHTRDWIIGDPIPDQIYRSVAESRRTLIVLSNDYIASGSWAQNEFRAVHLQASLDGRPRSVVIKMGALNLENAPEHIISHMKLNTYIEWGDILFWQRLHEAMPRKLKAAHVRRQEVTKKAVKTLANGGINAALNEEGKIVNVPALKGTCVV